MSFLCTSLLYAGTYNVAIIQENANSASLALLVSQLLSDIPYRDMQSTEAEKERSQRMAEIDAEKTAWKSVSDAYAKEDEKAKIPSLSIDKVTGVETQGFSIDRISYDDKLASILKQGSFSWFCDFYGYDLVQFVSLQESGGMKRCKVVTYDRSEDAYFTLFDKLTFTYDLSDITSSLRIALLEDFVNQSVGAIHLSHLPTTLSVSVDGLTVPIIDDSVVLPVGEHTVILSAYGYESKTIQVNIEEQKVQEMDASLTNIVIPTLSLLSLSGNVDWYIDGKKDTSSSALSLNTVQLPVLVQARKEGFLPATTQVTEGGSILSVSLRPNWAGDEDILKQKQQQFYGSFVSLIVAAGLTLAYAPLYNVYGGNEAYSKSLLVAGYGAIAMSGVLFLKNLFDYTGNILDY